METIPKDDMPRGVETMKFNGEVYEDVFDKLSNGTALRWDITRNRAEYKVTLKVNGAKSKVRNCPIMKVILPLVGIFVLFSGLC